MKNCIILIQEALKLGWKHNKLNIQPTKNRNFWKKNRRFTYLNMGSIMRDGFTYKMFPVLKIMCDILAYNPGTKLPDHLLHALATYQEYIRHFQEKYQLFWKFQTLSFSCHWAFCQDLEIFHQRHFNLVTCRGNIYTFGVMFPILIVLYTWRLKASPSSPPPPRDL